MKHCRRKSQSENRPRSKSRSRRRFSTRRAMRSLFATLEGKILFWSKGAERIYGWMSQESRWAECFSKILALIQQRFVALNRTDDQPGEWMAKSSTEPRSRREITVDITHDLIQDDKGIPNRPLDQYRHHGEEESRSPFLRAQRMETSATLAGGVAHDLTTSSRRS